MRLALTFIFIVFVFSSCSKKTFITYNPGSADSLHRADIKEGLSKDIAVWPNIKSYTNSDAWLIQNHESIKELNPRLLVIDFYNKKSEAYCREFVNKVIHAFAEGSRYHAFKDPSARPQLLYTLTKYIDLRDNSGKDISDKRPHKADGSFDEAALFADGFARYLGYRDSQNSRWLRLGELFDMGIINECWIVAPNTLYEVQGRARKYDSAFRFTGAYNECLNACYEFGEEGRKTAVTIRLGEINVDRGVGCATHAFGHALERMALGDIPYFGRVAGRFFNFYLDSRYGAPFDTQYSCPYYVKPEECFSFSGQTITTVNKYLPDWTFTSWGEGCGNIHFPVNARFQYDYNNAQTVRCSCENYGKKNGIAGADLQNDYNPGIVQQWKTSAYSDCGGEYVMYLRQNMPGYQSGAIGDDGKPMKSWWPFYYY